MFLFSLFGCSQLFDTISLAYYSTRCSRQLLGGYHLTTLLAPCSASVYFSIHKSTCELLIKSHFKYNNFVRLADKDYRRILRSFRVSSVSWGFINLSKAGIHTFLPSRELIILSFFYFGLARTGGVIKDQ